MDYLRCVILGVLRLRRVQLALTTILVSLLIMGFPHLEVLREQLLMLIAAILMVALGGYTVTDALYHGRPDPEQLDDLLETLVDELGVEVDAILDDEEEWHNAQT